MTPENIQDIFGHTIYQRALSLYNNNHVLETTRYENNVYASVRGSQENIYQVKIELSEQGNDFTAQCSCPYPRLCKHTGAVLLLLYNNKKGTKSSKKLLNEIREAQERFAGQEDNILAIRTNNSKKTSVDRSLEHFQYSTDNKIMDRDHRFRLVFVLSNPFTFSNSLKVRPGLQYIKKDGTYGRIQNYAQTDSAVPFTEKERVLLFTFIDFHGSVGGEVNLRDLAVFFTDNPDIPLLFEDEHGHKPVRIHKLEKAALSFDLSSQRNNEFLFKPVITVYDTHDNAISDEDGTPLYYEIGRNSVFFLHSSGQIFYRQDDLSAATLFSILRINRDTITAPDIRKLDEFARKHATIPVTFNFDTSAVRVRHIQPAAIIHLEPAYEDMIHAGLIFNYGGKEVTLHDTQELLIFGRNSDTREIETTDRNTVFEQSVYSYLRLFFKKNIDQKKRIFTSHNVFSNILVLLKYNLRDFLVSFGPQLLEKDFTIRAGKNKKNITRRSGKVAYRVKSDIDWFEIKAIYKDRDGSEEAITIDEGLLDQGLLDTGSSYTLISKDEIDRLRRVYKNRPDKNGVIKISKLDLPLIDELYQDTINKNPELEQAKALAQKLSKVTGIEPYPLPEDLKTVLRHYQEAGYNWLQFMRTHKLNACLADDMGLGKTVQALALLQKCREEKIPGTTLIIVPVSTIPNWEHEISKFTPGMTCLRHNGPGRKKEISELRTYDIILTSYHTMRNDIELLRKMNFLYIILDEAQNIKNAASQAFKAVKLLQSDHRLTLTGTPIENNTMDLWSQMNFLNPGLLGSRDRFRKQFTTPIEKNGDPDAAEQLRKLVFPFILRRKKEDVATELPSKEEIVLYIEMEQKQKSLYEKHRRQYKREVEKTIKSKGIKKSSIEIFDALLKLRQIALFPVLAGKEYADIPSCKFDLLKEMVEELLTENHKMLIFSQFVKSLHIIENHIKKNNIKYAYLDGSTRRRDLEIKKFQEDESIKMFLLSLKAGGVGINLTAADYVLLFDPWWNPAAESQAIDRSHRIGQKRKVIAYKMIVRDTVEEKILQLQQKKKKLVEDLVTEEKTFFKSLDSEDVLGLFD